MARKIFTHSPAEAAHRLAVVARHQAAADRLEAQRHAREVQLIPATPPARSPRSAPRVSKPRDRLAPARAALAEAIADLWKLAEWVLDAVTDDKCLIIFGRISDLGTGKGAMKQSSVVAYFVTRGLSAFLGNYNSTGRRNFEHPIRARTNYARRLLGDDEVNAAWDRAWGDCNSLIWSAVDNLDPDVRKDAARDVRKGRKRNGTKGWQHIALHVRGAVPRRDDFSNEPITTKETV
jgi:hypothetical protein